jgi:AhpD family alkylhydroperoxidase
MSTISPRIAYYKLAPDGIKPLPALKRYIAERGSQINGCAYCLDLHSKDALAAGETPRRLLALAAWEETPFFSGRERAALAGNLHKEAGRDWVVEYWNA